MTEPGTDQQPADDGSHASVGGAVDRPGGGRTDSETAVDEDLGAGDQPAG